MSKNTTQQVVSVPGGPESESTSSGWVGIVAGKSDTSATQTDARNLFRGRPLPGDLGKIPNSKPKR